MLSLPYHDVVLGPVVTVLESPRRRHLSVYILPQSCVGFHHAFNVFCHVKDGHRHDEDLMKTVLCDIVEPSNGRPTLLTIMHSLARASNLS